MLTHLSLIVHKTSQTITAFNSKELPGTRYMMSKKWNKFQKHYLNLAWSQTLISYVPSQEKIFVNIFVEFGESLDISNANYNILDTFISYLFVMCIL